MGGDRDQQHLPLHAPGGRGRAPLAARRSDGLRQRRVASSSTRSGRPRSSASMNSPRRRDPLRCHHLPPGLLRRIPCHGRSAAPRQGPALAGVHPLVEGPMERGEISPKSLWNFLLFLLVRKVFDELPRQVFLCNQTSTSLYFYSPTDATCCMLRVSG
jgi:hypothetical protein